MKEDPSFDMVWDAMMKYQNKCNELMLQNYALIHENERLKREIGSGLRDDYESQTHLDGGNAGR